MTDPNVRIAMMVNQLGDLQAENARLRAALARYGKHRNYGCCVKRQAHTHAGTECGCSCGLEDVLSAMEAETS